MPAPATPSLAYKVESWAIACLQAHATLAGVSIVHLDEDADAANNRIVVAAISGDQTSEGAKPFEVSLNIRSFVITRDAGLIESYSRAINETFASPPGAVSVAAFSYLAILDSEEEDKETRADSRQREKTFTLHALES